MEHLRPPGVTLFLKFLYSFYSNNQSHNVRVYFYADNTLFYLLCGSNLSAGLAQQGSQKPAAIIHVVSETTDVISWL